MKMVKTRWIKHSEICDYPMTFGICPKCGRAVGKAFNPLDPFSNARIGYVCVKEEETRSLRGRELDDNRR